MEQALEKMPDLKPWENWFILRWDKQKRWLWDIWSEIELKSFTSVSNSKRDIFLWEPFDNDIKVLIIWKDGRVKDISSLAMIVNFWDKFKWVTRTSNEWVILPNSSVRIVWKWFEEEWWKRFNKVITEQTK